MSRGSPTNALVRPMAPADVAAVLAVEAEAFTTGWPATAFARELTQNGMARYLVLEVEDTVCGYGGLWLMVDEAHIVTVAVLPALQRRGFGRLIVHALVQLALAEGMHAATLEVRESNAAARALYARYGFYEVGARSKYYQDNQEDAVIMTTEALASAAYQRRLAALEGELKLRLPGARIEAS